jgi:hypothetical protein
MQMVANRSDGLQRVRHMVTLAHRVDGTAYTIKALLKSSLRPLRPGV